MFHDMDGGWGMGFGWIFAVLFWTFIVLGIITLAKWLTGNRSTPSKPPATRNAREILEERYARGEIDREEYLEKRRDLES